MWEKVQEFVEWLNNLFYYDGHFCRECGARYNYSVPNNDCIVCKRQDVLTHTFRWWITQFTKIVLIVCAAIILFDKFVFVSP